MLLNPYRFSGGGGGTATTWDPAKKFSDIALTGSDLVAAKNTSTANGIVLSTTGKASGQHYFEVAITQNNPAAPFVTVGIAPATVAFNSFLGFDAASYSYYMQTGDKYNNNAGAAFGASYVQGDIIGVALDMTAGKIWFAKNNVWQASGNPAAGTNPAFTGITGTQYAGASLYNGTLVPVDMVTARFASGSLTYSPPAGFAAWDNSVSSAYWSTTDKSSDMVVSSDTKTTWRGTSGATHVITRGVTGFTTGKRYVEFYSPQARSQVPGQGILPGIVTSTFPLSGNAPGDLSASVGVSFRRFISVGDSVWLFPNGSSPFNANQDAAASTGWVGLAFDRGTGNVWIVVDGTWLGGVSPASSPSSGYTSVSLSGAMYPAISTYYPIGTYPDASVTLRVLASEMSIGATAFDPGQVLDGFLPWGV